MSTLPSVSSQISSAVVRAVDLGVGGVLELLGHEGAVVCSVSSLGLGDGALHALRAGREHELRAVGAQQLRRSMLMVSGMVSTTGSRAPRHTRPGRCRCCRWWARRWRCAGVMQPCRLGGVDHGQADAVLHAAARVERLQLAYDGRAAALDTPRSFTRGVPPMSWVMSSAIFTCISPVVVSVCRRRTAPLPAPRYTRLTL